MFDIQNPKEGMRLASSVRGPGASGTKTGDTRTAWTGLFQGSTPGMDDCRNCDEGICSGVEGPFNGARGENERQDTKTRLYVHSSHRIGLHKKKDESNGSSEKK